MSNPDFMQGICGVCGQQRGHCQPMTDAGNFLLPAWVVVVDGQEMLTHELLGDTRFKTTYTVIFPSDYGGKIRYIKNTKEDVDAKS
jgi:hypothetical protein